jgi:hypothetical protein
VDNIRYVQPCPAVSGASSVSAGPGLVLGPHNPEVTGSNPVPATSLTSKERMGRDHRPFRVSPAFPRELSAKSSAINGTLGSGRASCRHEDASTARAGHRGWAVVGFLLLGPGGWNPSSIAEHDRAGPDALRCRPLRGRVRGEVPPAVPGGRRHRLGCVHREVLWRGRPGRVSRGPSVQ